VIYQLRNGKIVASWVETDRLGALQQLGLVPSDMAALRPGAKKP
jgi:hypothetical protein